MESQIHEWSMVMDTIFDLGNKQEIVSMCGGLLKYLIRKLFPQHVY